MTLPATSEKMLDWGWDDYAPYYESLATAGLDDAGIDDWLRHWSDLVELLSEVGTRMHIVTTQDTTDVAARDAYHKFLEEVGEPAQAAEQQLKEHLLASGLEPEGFGVQLRAMRAEAELFRVIRDGVPNTRMQSFGGQFPDDDLWRLIAAIRAGSRCQEDDGQTTGTPR